ncbi:MAG: hypothetical protein GEU96_05430 [Propionibacteriales bacterium]|nr:hypothetical protein [Propionibacteriales bacterium]
MSAALAGAPRLGLLLTVLVSAVLAGGCVSVPDGGPVHDGPRAVAGDEEPLQRQIDALGPVEDADPATIVRGYIAAMRAQPASPGVVREFMTDEAAGRWRPDAGTAVYEGSPTLRVGSAGVVRLTADQIGSLDRRGSWATTRGDATDFERQLRLVEVDGQWRIANPPQGTLVAHDVFNRNYRPYTLYFFDSTSKILVPDQVYLPDADQTATLLLRGLVSGPTERMAGTLDSYVPASTNPRVSVRVDDDNGLATVAFGPEVGGYDADQRRLLAAQLTWTLDQVTKIRSIRVTSDGAPVTLVDRESVMDAKGDPIYDPADPGASRALFALQGRRVVTVKDGKVEPVSGVLGSGGIPVDAYAVDRDGRRVAAVTGGRVRVGRLTDDGPALETWFTEGVDLIRPQWDFFGLLWVGDRTPDGSALFTMRDGEWQAAIVADGPGRPVDIRAFAVARDGARIAVVDGAGSNSRLLVGRVVRPSSGDDPLRVDRWREVVTPVTRLTEFRDLAWASPTELAVIARRGSDGAQPFTVDIDGSEVLAPSLVDFTAVSIAESPSGVPTVVAADDGELYSQTENAQTQERWTTYVSDPAQERLTQPSYVE